MGLTSKARRKKLKAVSSFFQSLVTAISIVAVLIGLTIFVLAQDTLVVSTKYTFESERLPSSMTGYKIAQLSDIGNMTFRVKQAVESAKPDIVVVTGNLEDDAGQYKESLSLIAELTKEFPVYYILSDRDLNIGDPIIQALNSCGAVDISGKEVELKTDEDSGITVKLYGFPSNSEKSAIDTLFDTVVLKDNVFYIAAVSDYADVSELQSSGVDLFLAGGTYGNPKGFISDGGISTVVSGGLGKSPSGDLRILNFPEVVITQLSNGSIQNINPLEEALGEIVGE